MASIENLIWERIAKQDVVHLDDQETRLLNDEAVLAQLRYLGLAPTKVAGTIYEALSTMAGGEFETPVGTVQSVNVDPSRYSDTPEGCFELARIIGSRQPRAVLLILPAEKADPAFLALVQSERARVRVLITS